MSNGVTVVLIVLGVIVTGGGFTFLLLRFPEFGKILADYWYRVRSKD